jgi:adenylate cyclase
MPQEQLQTLKEQLSQAQESQNKGEFDVAEQLTTAVLSVLQASPSTSVELDNVYTMALLRYADIKQRRGSYNTALESAQQALIIAKRNQLQEYSAMALNCIGNVQIRLGDYQTALQNFDNALSIHTATGDKSGVALITGNIGIVYWSLGNYAKAQDYMSQALALHEEMGEKSSSARVMGNIGNVHAKLGDYHTALQYYHKAVSTHESLGETASAAHVMVNIGSVHQKLCNYDKALEYFAKTLSLYQVLGMKPGIALVTGNIGVIHGHLGDFNSALEYYGTALSAFTELGEKSGIARVTKNIGNVHIDMGNYTLALECLNRALAIHEELGEMSDIANVTGYIGTLYANSKFNAYNPSLAEELMVKALSQSNNLGLKDLIVVWHYHLSEFYRNQQRWEEAYIHYRKYIEVEKDINIDEIKQQDALREHQKAIEVANATASAKHQATEQLLHNVLPPSIANKMLEGSELIAEKLPNVSVLFADIVNFTKLSQQITAEELVKGLDTIFSTFDTLAEKYGLEKIKTIGDAYMVVSGAPEQRDDHAESIAQFALEMAESIKEFSSKSTGEQIQLRIGIHSGEVVAGVIGKKKFAYDIWGDAVNTAARMESHGEAGKIHVSEEFVSALNLNRPSDTLSYWEKKEMRVIERGEIEVKGKGIMRTYFLERSADGKG